jgi:hypothetical protein
LYGLTKKSRDTVAKVISYLKNAVPCLHSQWSQSYDYRLQTYVAFLTFVHMCMTRYPKIQALYIDVNMLGMGFSSKSQSYIRW